MAISLTEQSLGMLDEMLAELPQGQREEILRQVADFAQKQHPSDKRVLSAMSTWGARELVSEVKSVAKLLRTFFDSPEDKRALLEHIRRGEKSPAPKQQESTIQQDPMTLSLQPVAEKATVQPDQMIDKAHYLDCLRRELFTKLYAGRQVSRQRPAPEPDVAGCEIIAEDLDSFAEPSQDVVERRRDAIRQRALEQYALRAQREVLDAPVCPSSPADVSSARPQEAASPPKVRIGQRTSLDEFFEARVAVRSRRSCECVSRAHSKSVSALPPPACAKSSSQASLGPGGKRGGLVPAEGPALGGAADSRPVKRQTPLSAVYATRRSARQVQDFASLLSQAQAVLETPSQPPETSLAAELQAMLQAERRKQGELAAQKNRFEAFQAVVERVLASDAPREEKEKTLRTAAAELRPELTADLLRVLVRGRRDALDVLQYQRHVLSDGAQGITLTATNLKDSHPVTARYARQSFLAAASKILDMRQALAHAKTAPEKIKALRLCCILSKGARRLAQKLRLIALLNELSGTKRLVLAAKLRMQKERLQEAQRAGERLEELRDGMRRVLYRKDKLLGFAE